MPGLGDLSPQATIAIGIIVGLISTSVQSLGLTLQRQSHLREDEKDYEDRKPAWKRPRWQAGMLMFVGSNIIGSTIQITTLPLPVLSTLQAAGLVFNTAFATLLLKESFTRYSAIGTVFTCVGAALIATFGAVGEPAHNLEQLVYLLKQRGFVIWLSSTMTAAVLTILLAHLLKVYSSHRHIRKTWFDKQHSEGRPRSDSSTSLSSSTQLKRSFTSNLPKAMQTRLFRLRVIRGLMYAFISGILSAHSLLMAKSAVELIVRTVVDHVNQFNRFESWLILLALVFFALSQLYYLHLGLRLCSTSVLYPFVFCIYNIIAILDGLIYFQQGSLLTHLDAGLVALGTVILLAGVLALSWRLDDAEPDEPAAVQITATTPLGPGLASFSTSQDSLSEHASRHGSMATNDSNERTPLINKRTRAHSIDSKRPQFTQRPTAIWAELNDESMDDILSSLPTRSMMRPRRQNSGGSQAVSNSSRPGSAGGERRASMPGQSSMKGGRAASADHVKKIAEQDQPEEVAEEQSTATVRVRRRGHTVHFEDGSRQSRYDSLRSKTQDDTDNGQNHDRDNG